MGNDRAQSVEALVVEGLHYCCPYFFFTKFQHKSRVLIALRLGCSERAIGDWQAKKRAGVLTCPHHKVCLEEIMKQRAPGE